MKHSNMTEQEHSLQTQYDKSIWREVHTYLCDLYTLEPIELDKILHYHFNDYTSHNYGYFLMFDARWFWHNIPIWINSMKSKLHKLAEMAALKKDSEILRPVWAKVLRKPKDVSLQ